MLFLATLGCLWILSPLTRDYTVALRNESAESQPLDHQGFSFLFLCFQFSSISCVQLFVNPWTVCSTPGFPVHHQPLEFAQTHVHQIGDAILPSHPLSSPSPLACVLMFVKMDTSIANDSLRNLLTSGFFPLLSHPKVGVKYMVQNVYVGIVELLHHLFFF